MPRKVHDGPAIGTAQRPAPEQQPEWEPRPLPGSWWQTCQEREALAGRLLTAFTDPAAARGRDQTRRRGLAKLLDWLQSQPGETWQDRWLASGADAAGSGWTELPLGREPVPRHRRDELTSGLVLLVAGQVLLLLNQTRRSRADPCHVGIYPALTVPGMVRRLLGGRGRGRRRRRRRTCRE